MTVTDHDFGDDAKTTELSGDKLERVTELAREQVRRAQAVENAEHELSEAKSALNEVCQGELPQLMDDLGLKTFDLDNGWSVKVKDSYKVSPPKDKMDEALDWLIEQGFEKVIKNQFICSFDRGDEKHMRKFKRDLAQRKKPIDTKITRGVAGATMRKTIVDMIENGVNVPKKLFGVWQHRVSEVKGPK